MWMLWIKISFIGTFMKWGPKGRILIFVDNDPRSYKLSCFGSFGLDFFSFIQIAFGNAVTLHISILNF